MMMAMTKINIAVVRKACMEDGEYSQPFLPLMPLNSVTIVSSLSARGF